MAGRRQRASRPPRPTPLKISRKTRLRLNHQAVCAGLSIFPRLWGIKREEDQVEDSCCAATAAKRAAMQQEMKSWTFQTWNTSVLFLSTQAWFCGGMFRKHYNIGDTELAQKQGILYKQCVIVCDTHQGLVQGANACICGYWQFNRSLISPPVCHNHVLEPHKAKTAKQRRDVEAKYKQLKERTIAEASFEFS